MSVESSYNGKSLMAGPRVARLDAAAVEEEEEVEAESRSALPCGDSGR